MSLLIVCRLLASNYQANNHYNRAGAKCPIFLVIQCFAGKSSDVLVIMEYCPNGNLREFLKSNRDLFNFEKESLVQDLSEGFGKKNLMYFAWQVAKGMAFLASRKVTMFSLRGE